MKRSILFLARYIGILYTFFLFSRILFLFFNHAQSFKAPLKDWFLSIGHGLIFDISMIGYIIALPILIVIISNWFGHNFFKRFLKYYTYAIIILLSILHGADNELYKYWGYRIDTTALAYTSTPKEMFASLIFLDTLKVLLVMGIMAYGGIYLFNKLVFTRFLPPNKNRIATTVLLVTFLPFVLLGIRGGTDVATLSTARAFFHPNSFINHACLNAAWNFMYTVIEDRSGELPYHYLSDTEAEDIAQDFLSKHNKKSDTTTLLLKNKPNVILIILESFGTQAIHCYDSTYDATPNLDAIARDGIKFNRIYASGSRSDKGLIALLSGYPSYNRFSIMSDPVKNRNLPGLFPSLKNNGYYTSFYYGGNPHFAGLQSYLVNSGVDKVISKNDFSETNIPFSKWGAHDEDLYKKVMAEIKEQKQPFFTSIYTLSSHEPFIVPANSRFNGANMDDKYLNSIFYSDSCLGVFYRELKNSDYWENSILVITADHGTRGLGINHDHEPGRHHIPLIISGGALKERGIEIDNFGSQVDIAPSILSQLNILNNEYEFGKDLFTGGTNPYAIYVFVQGFGYVSDSVSYYHNYNNDKFSYNWGNKNPELEKTGLAYMQYLYMDYLKR